jgi:hypothetical protein
MGYGLWLVLPTLHWAQANHGGSSHPFR